MSKGRLHMNVPLRYTAILLALFSLASPLAGQQDPAPPASDPPAVEDQGAPQHDAPVHGADEVLVTARRIEEDALHVPRSLTTVDALRLAQRASFSVLDSLDDTIGVWVEKRTTTTSDPVIRGLSGGNILALIDGNSLSSFWGEGGFAGDDMYGKVDADTIERIEVLRGPASVLYGSNALGGVINFITRSSPIDYTSGPHEAGARLKVTAGTAAQDIRVRTETYGATGEFKYLVGASYRDVGDLRAGGDVGRQRPTSGRDRNVDARFDWLSADSTEMTFTVQDVKRDHLHRFYRPTQDNSNDRTAFAFTSTTYEPTSYWSEAQFKLYHQDKKDERRFFTSGNEGVARWQTTSADLQFTHATSSEHTLIYGVGLHRDEGESPDDEQFTITQPSGNVFKASPDSTWDNGGVFAYDTLRLDDRWSVTGGLRYDHFRFDSRPDAAYANNPQIPFPAVDKFTDRRGAFTGGLGLSVELSEERLLFADYSRGFRQFAPNFGLKQLGFGVVAPNDLLDPVTADNFEVGTKWRNEESEGAVAVYYTRFKNFQNIVPGTYLGAPFFDIEGDGIEADDAVFVTKGNGKAYVMGIEAETSVQLASLAPGSCGPEWSVGWGFMWNTGKDRTNEEPLRHTHPPRMLLSLRWDDVDEERNGWWELSADFVRHFTKVPTSRQASDPTYRQDPQDPTSGPLRSDGGLPGYSVFDLRGGFDLSPQTTVSLALENVFDKKYRTAHSRVDASGINFQMAVDMRF